MAQSKRMRDVKVSCILLYRHAVGEAGEAGDVEGRNSVFL
jgi:hypothetical protein